MSLKNVAGLLDCDYYIRQELEVARIPILKSDNIPNINPDMRRATLYGEIGTFNFIRAWHYWVVTGMVPLTVAEEIYNDPLGKRDVRAVGHCGRVDPKEWSKWYDENGLELISPKDWNEVEELVNRLKFPLPTTYKVSENFELDGAPYINLYHIDSEAGLRFFVDTLAKHGLVTITTT